MSLRNRLEDHLWLSMALALLSLTATLVLGFSLFYFETQATNQRHADERAKITATQTIRKPLCNLVYAYENIDQNTPNSVIIVKAWREIGLLVGCPEGIKP